jgi:hypothetical protein
LKGAVYGTKPATLTELWQEIGPFCAAFPAAALVATCHLLVFAAVALTDGNAGKLDAYVGHHGVSLNVLQGQG